MSIFKDDRPAAEVQFADWRDYYPAWAVIGLIPLHQPDTPLPNGNRATGKEPVNDDWTSFVERRIQLKESKSETFKDIAHELERGRNIGMVIPPGVLCLDYDDPATTSSVLALYPDAPAQVTQSGGVHLFFRIKPGETFKGTTKLNIDGLIFDLRAAGRSQVACFPSIGLLGKYHWLRPLPVDKDDLPLRPEACTQALDRGTHQQTAAMVDVNFGTMPANPQPPSKTEIKKIAALNAELANLIEGARPIGERGSRNNELLKAVGTVYAALFDAHNMPKASDVFRMLRWCVLAYTPTGPDNPPPTLTELWSMCCRVGTQELNKWFERQSILQAVTYWHNLAIKQREAKEKETVKRVASELGIPPEELKKQAILYLPNGHHYYVFNEEAGGYKGPVAANGLLARITEGCKNLFEFADIYNTTRTGETVVRNTHFILRDFGKPVTRIDRLAGQGLPTYDRETETMTVGVWALRDTLEPRYDKHIAEWLKLLGNDDHENLLDWLATIHRTDRPNSCLYLKGPKEIGKSLLVDGLARLWGRKATRYRDVMARFNDSFLRSPLVHLDEGLSDKSDSLRFREFISENEHVIETKGQPQFTLRGCARCIVTSNNVNALKIYEPLNTDDIEAISSRIMWVSTDEKAATYLRTMKGREATEQWVEGDLLARHILWLINNREVKTDHHENRFLVPGTYHPEKLQMLREFRSNGSIFEVIANYVIECATVPKGQHYVKYAGLAFTHGTIGVNRKGLVDYWSGKEKEYGDCPNMRDMKASLRIMSKNTEIAKRTVFGPRKLNLIDYDLLMEEVERLVPDSVVEQVEDFLNKSVDDK